MTLLASNFLPLKTNYKAFYEYWAILFNTSDCLNIAVGYASNESILYLRKLMELNAPKKLNICLGMANFDGITNSQYVAAKDLQEFLTSTKSGDLFISTQFPFHGKVQTFSSKRQLTTGIVGSSNLSNIVPPTNPLARGNYELDFVITDNKTVSELDKIVERLFFDASIPLDKAKNLIVKQDRVSLLDSSFEVKKVTKTDKEFMWNAKTDNEFEIPIKTTAKSNLNVYFGEGRKNPQGFVKPRHWYEVELIVAFEVQNSNKNYPANKEFIVYTDDGYKFVLKTSGDYGKNLRSRDDLTVLGRWLKGRMEQAGALNSGAPVTAEVLLKYGRDSMTLISTREKEHDERTSAELEVWLVDFGVSV